MKKKPIKQRINRSSKQTAKQILPASIREDWKSLIQRQTQAAASSHALTVSKLPGKLRQAAGLSD